MEQQGRLPKREQAPVLHGPDIKVGYGHQIHLGQGEAQAEEVLEELERRSGHVQGKVGLKSGLK